MKKILTIMLVLAMLFVGVFLLTGCGEQENTKSSGKENTGTKESNSAGEYNGDTKGAASLKNVTDKNYKEVVKSVFGIDIEDTAKGWTVSEVESPNGVNNLNIEWTYTSEQDANAIFEEYFNKCKNVSKDGIYSQGFNESYTAVIKKDKYEDFSSLSAKELTHISTLYQIKWIYDNNGASIQFYMNINENGADASFVLLGN